MILGRVTGTVVSAHKHTAYEGKKLLVVQPLDEAGRNAGEVFLAVDKAQAGEGDTVLVLVEGNGVRQIWGMQGAPFPVLETIVGIVDDIELGAEASR